MTCKELGIALFNIKSGATDEERRRKWGKPDPRTERTTRHHGETDIINNIKAYCNKLVPNCFAYRTEAKATPDRYGNYKNKSKSKKGQPDVTVIYRGFFVGPEVKRIYKKGKDRQSEEQKIFEQYTKNAKGYYFTTSGFEDFYPKFEAIRAEIDEFWSMAERQQVA